MVDDAEAGGGDDEAGVGAGDAEVAAAREFDAGAEDVAVEDGDGGGVGAAEGGGGGEEGGVGGVGEGARVLLGEGVEVEAGAEAGVALTGEEDDLAVELAGAALEPAEHRRGEGVALARVIEDPAQEAGGERLLAHASIGVGHGVLAGVGSDAGGVVVGAEVAGPGVVVLGRALRTMPLSLVFGASGSCGCRSPFS